MAKTKVVKSTAKKSQSTQNKNGAFESYAKAYDRYVIW